MSIKIDDWTEDRIEDFLRDTFGRPSWNSLEGWYDPPDYSYYAPKVREFLLDFPQIASQTP